MSPDKLALDELRIDRSVSQQRGAPRWVAIVIVSLLALAGGAGWWLTRAKPATVSTAAVRAVAGGGQRTLLNASGYVTARREATVSSKVTGKVIEVLIEEGMKVELGQVLARIDSSNVRASLGVADAQLTAARSSLNEMKVRLDEAERELRRQTHLFENKISTQADLDHAEAEAKSLRARLEKQAADISVAEREVALWQQQLEDTVIRSPFAGVVTVKNAQPGEMISPMSAGGSFTRTGICTIVDMNSLEIEVDVNESYINRVEPGQRVEATLDSYPDWRIPSKVIAIIPTADRQKATVRVRVAFDKLDARILPHMGIKVAFQGSVDESKPITQSSTVPKSAVRHENGQDIVWVVQDGRIERRAVSVAGTHGDGVMISAGLNSNEKVVIQSPGPLTDGMKIREAKP
ncbi:MAG: efflux RND transporter periplasmic adaptor subunit [Verrucomicrobiales bacterium]|nr:efflux RND transporter periplasmic adaptor subunit [Verrucomicrobiales bacterium]